jgi:hypothetical protein
MWRELRQYEDADGHERETMCRFWLPKLKQNAASLWSSLSAFAATRRKHEMSDQITVSFVHHDSCAALDVENAVEVLYKFCVAKNGKRM